MKSTELPPAGATIAPPAGEPPSTGALTEAHPQAFVSVPVEHPGRYAAPSSDPFDGLIGRGGMGLVRRVMDRALGRMVVRKELLPEIRSGGPTEARLMREARITGSLEHPSIVPVYDLGCDASGRLFYTMREIRGRTLAVAMEQAGPLHSRLGLLGHFVALCQAIAYAHDQGVIHRDIKPHNVMVGPFGETVVLDWGIARRLDDAQDPSPVQELVRPRPLTRTPARNETLDEFLTNADDSPSRPPATEARPGPAKDPRTREGSVLGTPWYMAPELALGHISKAGPHSDIFSLGAVLYQLLTGVTPYEQEDAGAAEVIELAQRCEIKPVLERAPLAPPELAAIAEKALRKDPNERYGSAGQMARDIDAWRDGRRVSVYAYSSLELVRNFVLRNKALSVITLALALSLLCGFVLTSLAWMRSEEHRIEAVTAREEAETQARLVHHGLAMSLLYRAWESIQARDPFAAATWAGNALLHEPSSTASPYVDPDIERRERRENSDALAEIRGALAMAGAGSLLEYRGLISKSQELLGAGAMSPDGLLMALHGEKSSVKVLRVEDGQLEWTLPGTSTEVIAMAWSPTSGLLATGDSVGTLRLFDRGGAMMGELPGHQGRLRSLAFSPNGALLASSGEDGRLILRGASGESPRTLDLRGSDLRGIAFSPEGDRIYSVDRDGQVRVTALPSGQTRTLSTFPERCVSLAISPDGARLAVGSMSALTLLDTQDGAKIAQVGGFDGAIEALGFHPGGELLASGGVDGQLRLWRAADLAPLSASKVHSDQVWGTHFTSDGALLVSTSWDGTARRWGVGSNRSSCFLPGQGSARASMAWSPDGRLLALGSWDGVIDLFELPGGRHLRSLKAHQNLVWDLDFSPDGSMLLSGSFDRRAILWDPERGTILKEIHLDDEPIAGVAFSPNGRQLALGQKDGGIGLFELEARELRLLRRLEAHKDRLARLRFSPDGARLASVSWDGWLRVWDLESGIPGVEIRAHTDWISGLDWSPDGRTLATSSRDRRVLLWSAVDGSPAGELLGHADWVNQVAFHPSGPYLLSGSDDGEYRVWDLRSGASVLRLKARSPNPLAWSPDGTAYAIIDEADTWVLPFGTTEDTPALELLKKLSSRTGLELRGAKLEALESGR